MVKQQPLRGEEAEPMPPRRLSVSRILVRLLYIWVMFGVIVLGLRVFLLAFSANPATSFVTFIYETSDRYMEPFRGIFSGREVGTTGYLDISAVFGIIMYLLLAWGISHLIAYIDMKIERAQRLSTTL